MNSLIIIFYGKIIALKMYEVNEILTFGTGTITKDSAKIMEVNKIPLLIGKREREP